MAVMVSKYVPAATELSTVIIALDELMVMPELAGEAAVIA